MLDGAWCIFWNGCGTREREKRLRLRIIGLSQEKGGGDEVEEAGSSKLTTFEKNKRAEE